jgi:hypothetical protein
LKAALNTARPALPRAARTRYDLNMTPQNIGPSSREFRLELDSPFFVSTPTIGLIAKSEKATLLAEFAIDPISAGPPGIVGVAAAWFYGWNSRKMWIQINRPDESDTPGELRRDSRTGVLISKQGGMIIRSEKTDLSIGEIYDFRLNVRLMTEGYRAVVSGYLSVGSN